MCGLTKPSHVIGAAQTHHILHSLHILSLGTRGFSYMLSSRLLILSVSRVMRRVSSKFLVKNKNQVYKHSRVHQSRSSTTGPGSDN